MQEIMMFYKSVIDTYWGGMPFHILLFAAFIVIFFFEKDRIKRCLYLYFPLVVLIGMYMPFTYKICVYLWGESVAYYCRLYSVIPVFFIIAYGMVLLITKVFSGDEVKNKLLKLVVVIILCFGIIYRGRSFYSLDTISIAANPARIPEDAVLVADIAESQRKDGQDIVIAVPESLSTYIRQYDANLYMPYGRIWGEAPLYTQIMGKPDISKDEARYVMNWAGGAAVNYLSVVKTEQNLTSFSEIGAVLVGEGNGHYVFLVSNVNRSENVYDDTGLLKEQYYYNDKDKSRIRDFGYAGVAYEYDKNGRVEYQLYIDKNGEVMMTDYKSAGYKYTYDSDGKKIRDEFVDLDKKPIEGVEGIQSVEYFYDGRYITGARFCDKNGKVKNNREGICGFDYIYDNDYKLKEFRFINRNGNLAEQSGTGISLIKYSYDELGNRSEKKYDLKGNEIK